MSQIDDLYEIIKKSNKIVVFSGAGLSTNSGIPDFRSADGLYSQKFDYKFMPEEIISHSFFNNYPEDFYKFYFEKMIYPDALPNVAHKFFAKLEAEGKVLAVITQNIDNLHQDAGSENVIEIHGSVKRNYCTKCKKFYALEDITHNGIPYCTCGGIIKPDVVLYEEGLNQSDVMDAVVALSEADTLIIVGTSLTVYPAASFINYFRGENLVLLNKTPTQYDYLAKVVIYDDIKNVIEKLERKIKRKGKK